MRSQILYFTLALSLLTTFCAAQNKKCEMSAPLDIKQTGVNKVLSLHNGNTMLFHFEPGKSILVKVFDSVHREIASEKNPCRILDLAIIKAAVFKGLFEINNEAVLFIEQEHLSKYGLVRLRFNTANGKLTEETLSGESKSNTKVTKFFVMKNKNEDSYAILFCTDIPLFFESKVYVSFYNSNHQVEREVPLEVDRKKYDYLAVAGAEVQPNGILVSLKLGKLKENGTTGTGGSAGKDPTEDQYDHHLAMFYIPANSSVAVAASANLGNNVYPFYTNYTYNPFAKTLNLLLLSYKEITYRNGLELLPGALLQHILFKMDEDNMALNYKWIVNKSANDTLRQKIDTNRYFEGLPINMYTNENGLSTVVFESLSKFAEPETRTRLNQYSYLGNIAVTQFDDEGNELWGTVLPLSQRLKSYSRYYSAYELAKKWQSQIMFADIPDGVYDRQFVSINTYSFNRNTYIIYNDYNKNFNNSIEKPGDTVYTFQRTNTCYYKLNRKREVTKSYLFGEPAANEYKSCFIEGADFDEKRGIYASLIQYKKDNEITLNMAWSYLE